MSVIGINIKKLRDEQSVTQEALASHLGLSAQAVSKWENGTSMPDIMLLPELADYFGIAIDALFKENMESYPNKAQRYMSEYEMHLTEEAFSKATREFYKLRETGCATDYDLMSYAFTLEIHGKRDLQTAEELYNDAIKMDSKNRKNQYYKSQRQLIQLLSYLGRDDESVVRHRSFVESEPDSLDYRLNLIFAYKSAKRFDEARRAISAAQQRFLDNTSRQTLNYWTALIDIDEGRNAEADKTLTELSKQNCEDANSSRWRLYVSLGRFSEAASLARAEAMTLEQKGLTIEAGAIRKYAETLMKLADTK